MITCFGDLVDMDMHQQTPFQDMLGTGSSEKRKEKGNRPILGIYTNEQWLPSPFWYDKVGLYCAMY